MCVSLTTIGADHQIKKGMQVHTIKEVLFFCCCLVLVQLFSMLQDAVIFAFIIPRGRIWGALLCEAASLETRTEMIVPSLILLSS